MEPVRIMWRQIMEMARDTIALLPQIAVATLVLILTWAIAALGRSLITRTLSRTKLRPSLQDLFTLLTSILIWVFGIMIAAVIVFPGLTPASILAGLGIGSVAIGFANRAVQNGAATACSIETTLIPSSGRIRTTSADQGYVRPHKTG